MTARPSDLDHGAGLSDIRDRAETVTRTQFSPIEVKRSQADVPTLLAALDRLVALLDLADEQVELYVPVSVLRAALEADQPPSTGGDD